MRLLSMQLYPVRVRRERRWVRLFSMQPYPVRVRRETRRWVRLFSMQLYPVRVRLRDEAMGAVAQRATVPRECESEIEQRLWASASWVITTRASFWVCRCR